ncbi:hypothetical protein HDE_05689 [Halotydeus destructor]|nr:hypothetical protein HDE_05689 [Halotydeus destructor]
MYSLQTHEMPIDLGYWNVKVGNDVMGTKPTDYDNNESYDIYADLMSWSLQSIDMRLTRTCFPGVTGHTYIFGLNLGLTAAVRAAIRVLSSRCVSRISFITLDGAKVRVFAT